MTTKRYDPTATDFNGRYARWVAALESGDDAELLEATVALPTLNKRVLKKLAAVDRDEPDSTVRAERKRVIVLLSEINANQAARLRERKQAEQRRRDRTESRRMSASDPALVVRVKDLRKTVLG